MLRKSSENCVFTPNDGLVEKKCVVWTIVCCDLSVINRWLAMEEHAVQYNVNTVKKVTYSKIIL